MKLPDPSAAAAAAISAAAGEQQQQKPGVLLKQQPPHTAVSHILDTLVTSYGQMQVGWDGLTTSRFSTSSSSATACLQSVVLAEGMQNSTSPA
jgi:hypothetical protein